MKNVNDVDREHRIQTIEKSGNPDLVLVAAAWRAQIGWERWIPRFVVAALSFVVLAICLHTQQRLFKAACLTSTVAGVGCFAVLWMESRALDRWTASLRVVQDKLRYRK